MKRNKILITGGAGFIGSNLALKLVSCGAEVVVLDNLSEQVHGEEYTDSPLFISIKDKVDFIHGTVQCRDDWIQALSGVDTVVHLAAETGTGQSMYEIEKYTDININGTSIFLDILANESHNVSKMIVASSRSIYGEGKYHCTVHGDVYPKERVVGNMKNGDFEVKCPVCKGRLKLCATDESSDIHPSSIYGITKQVQEQMFMLMGRSLGIDSVALRFQNVYGPGQSLSNPYTGILSIFSTSILNGNDINIFEDGLESRDFVYIDDVVDSIVLSIFNEEAKDHVFNVGSGVNTNVLAVAEKLITNYASNSKVKVTYNFRVGDIRHNYACLNLIKDKLNFTPKVDFDTGINKFCDWVKRQEVKLDRYQHSIEEMKSKGLYK